MRVLVTGGSSFIGAHLCRLLTESHEPIAIYGNTPVNLNGIRAFCCDLSQPSASETLAALKADAVVHLAFKVQRKGISAGPDELSELNERMLESVLALDLPLVYASSTVVHWPSSGQYARDRIADEARVYQHTARWDIVRPCAPFGARLKGHEPQHKESFHTLADLVKKSPFVPVIGSGDYLRQPIYVDDFNGAIIGLLERGLTNSAYDAGGAQVLSFNEIIATMARAFGVCRLRAHIPKSLFVKLASYSADFDPELIQTIDTDDLADPRALSRASGVNIRGFADGVGCLI